MLVILTRRKEKMKRIVYFSVCAGVSLQEPQTIVGSLESRQFRLWCGAPEFFLCFLSLQQSPTI